MKKGQKTFCILHSAFYISCGGRRTATGFTLIEVLVAMALLVAALAITFTTFYSITRAWERGQVMAENLNRGEFIMEQLVGGLRSAFYPVRQTNASSAGTTGGSNTATVSSSVNYGFVLEDNGEDETARDSISWVKMGPALLGPEDPRWRGLHRIKISLEEDDDGKLAVVSRVWQPYGNSLDFKPEDVVPFVISEKVLGMNCRVAKEAKEGEGWEWEDEWDALDCTNRLPLAVEIVLYLPPLDGDKEPVKLTRIVEIPVAPLSWSTKK